MPNPDPLARAKEALQRRQFPQAEQLLQRHLRRFPLDADALDLLGMTFAVQLLRDRALYYFQQALKARPTDIHIAMHVGEILRQLLREGDAADAVLPFVRTNPHDTIAATFAANMLLDSKRLVECRQVLDAALALAPDQPGLRHTEARLLQRVGDSSAACRALKALSKIAPNEDGLALSLANTLNYDQSATPRDQYVAHRAYGRTVAAASKHEPFAHAPSDDPDRPLRIGVVSPDLRAHSVAFFVEPILEHLDRACFSVHCYYTRDIIDAVSDRLRKKADSFVVSVRADAVQLAKKINEDRIDILIELCGLFAGSNLETMQLRPAPVQATFIGYPNTTGLDSIDYRIVDSLTDPPTPERYTSEELVRLDPSFLCYRPDETFLAVPPGPALRDGPFTFASFNAAMKLSDTTLDVWSRVLAGSPGTRLLIKASGMEEHAVRDSLRQRLTRAGIDNDRVEVVGRTPTSQEHLSRYRDVDLALDTIPYNGTTTTCEAMLMGVPVLTLSGMTHASRVGASLAHNAGVPSLVCTSQGEFIEKACAFAADRTTLTPLREGLRERLLGSTLCDGPAYVQRFADLMRALWRRRCEGPPPTRG